MSESHTTSMDHSTTRETTRGRGPIAAFLNLFSSIWLGVTMLTILFVYSSVGSAVPPLRQLPIFEMTEYEWFNWWPFTTLVVLICLNITIATIRRIPFEPLRYGAWTIHTGLLIMSIGCVWYFSTKVEGDVAVARRVVSISMPGAETIEIPVKLGNRAAISDGETTYTVTVSDINPQWVLVTGEDAGLTDYAVTLTVFDGEQEFRRQILSRHPEFTEDIIRTDDPQQPFKRAVKVAGTPLIDEQIQIDLSYRDESWFYLVKSAALYIREVGSDRWIERPINGLPRYNEYVSDLSDAWPSPGLVPEAKPLSVTVPSVHEDDPLAGVDLVVTDYLPFAVEESRAVPGGDDAPLNPRATVELFMDGTSRRERHELAAFDPEDRALRVEGREQFRFMWITSDDDIDAATAFTEPMLNIRIASLDMETSFPIRQTLRSDPTTPFINIGDTGYAYQVTELMDDLTIAPGDTRSYASVNLRMPDGEEIERVVGATAADAINPSAVGADGQHSMQPVTDDELIVTYTPGNMPPRIMLFAGPEEDQLRVSLFLDSEEPTVLPVTVGQTVQLTDVAGMLVSRYSARSTMETKPRVIPKNQRDRGFDEQFSMVRVTTADATASNSATHPWLFYHLYAFEDAASALRRFPYRPGMITLEDGRRFEIMFSREREELPASVVLDDFRLTTHVGGFTGTTASIRDWTSVVRFDSGEGSWTDDQLVSVNQPAEFDGYWFFQSQWDPPEAPRFQGDTGSGGLNYTVLGVGNRNGVNTMLFGTIISVIGMIYAFYVKPMIKRRRQLEVYESVRREKDEKISAMKVADADSSDEESEASAEVREGEPA